MQNFIFRWTITTLLRFLYPSLTFFFSSLVNLQSVHMCLAWIFVTCSTPPHFTLSPSLPLSGVIYIHTLLLPEVIFSNSMFNTTTLQSQILTSCLKNRDGWHASESATFLSQKKTWLLFNSYSYYRITHTHKKSQGSDNFHRYLSLQRKLEIKALPSFKEKDFSNDTLHFFYFSTGEVFA